MKTQKKKTIHRRKLPSNTVWKSTHLVTCYQLAKEGLGDKKIAEYLGVTYPTFWSWKKKKASLRHALKEGRKQENGVKSFLSYVHTRLPEHLKDIWEEILGNEDKDTTVTKVERMLSQAGRRGRQQLFLHALVHYNFNLSDACKAVNITKKQFDNWVMNDPDFGELIQEMEWHKDNLFEGQLVGLVKAGDPGAIKFANMTRNAKRGYGNKKEMTKNVNVSVNGQIINSHTVVPIDELDLPLEERKKLLEQVRRRKEQANSSYEDQ
jgi:hypothetical protein